MIRPRACVPENEEEINRIDQIRLADENDFGSGIDEYLLRNILTRSSALRRASAERRSSALAIGASCCKRAAFAKVTDLIRVIGRH